MKLSEVAGLAGIAVRGDGEFEDLGFLSGHYAKMLVFLEDRRFAAALRRNESVSAVLTTEELAEHVPARMALGVCAAPRLAFAEIHNRLALAGFYWEDFGTVIDPRAQVHPSAWVAETNVRIGAHSVIGPHATVLERCVIGEGVSVGAGSVLGGVGFQTVRASRPMAEMRHAGGLKIRDHAHILPGAVIATGLFRQATEIRAEARVGAQAFISHSVEVGARSFIGHGAVINGNVIIGEDAWVGPGAVIANDLSVGRAAFVSIGAVVIRDVEAGKRVSGNFAVSHRRLLRSLAEMEGSDPAT